MHTQPSLEPQSADFLAARLRRNERLNSIRNSAKEACIAGPKQMSEHTARKRRESLSGADLQQMVNEWEADHANEFDANYESEEKIGEGAHGVVRKCVHRESKKVYAVKQLKMDREHVMFLKRNFLQIRAFKHPNIIKYKALYLDKKQHNVCYLVMEYVPYKSLLALKQPHQDQLKKIIHQVLEALTYAHAHFVCHRDIKPANILYDPQQQIVKIIDFGVSKNFKQRGHVYDMLTVTGTQFYRAPQMWLGGGYNFLVDSWAVGVTLYQLITKKTPFEAEYHADTIENILTKEPDLSGQGFEDYSHLLKDLLTRLLKKSKHERISCAAAHNHLWFNPPSANELALFRSDVGLFKRTAESLGGNSIEGEEPQSKGLRRTISKLPDDLIEPNETDPSESKKNFGLWISTIQVDEEFLSKEGYKIELPDAEEDEEDKMKKRK